MKILPVLLLILISLITPISAATTIRLIDHISIRAPYVELGEIAKITTTDSKIKESLETLIVSEAPLLGKNKTISAYSLKNKLSTKGFENISILGSHSTVNIETEVVPIEKIKSMINQWVTDEIGAKSSFEIEYTKLPSHWRIPIISDSTFTISTRKKKLYNNITLKIRAINNNKVISTNHARIKLNIYELLPVLTRSIKRGETIDKSSIEIKKIKTSHSLGLKVDRIEDIIGKEAKKNLQSGSYITVNDITSKILIKRGSFNRIIVINNGVRMVVNEAQAIESGKKNEFIQFKNPLNNNNNLRAQVMRSGLATIKLK
jgi:flagella basal body P-ring formation protein FlgA